jgi:hypothetical protein
MKVWGGSGTDTQFVTPALKNLRNSLLPSQGTLKIFPGELGMDTFLDSRRPVWFLTFTLSEENQQRLWPSSPSF